MAARKPTLVFVVGPPAVGKTTVGRALERITGFPLFHAHMTIELVLPFFDFGTDPFNRLVGSFRRQMFEEVAASALPGLVYTGMWAFDNPDDQRYVEEVIRRFDSEGGRTVFVELWADLETRLARNRTEPRLSSKPSKRDIAASDARLLKAHEQFQLNSEGDFPFAEHLWVDNTHLDPKEVAERAIARFSLPVLNRD